MLITLESYLRHEKDKPCVEEIESLILIKPDSIPNHFHFTEAEIFSTVTRRSPIDVEKPYIPESLLPLIKFFCANIENVYYTYEMKYKQIVISIFDEFCKEYASEGSLEAAVLKDYNANFRAYRQLMTKYLDKNDLVICYEWVASIFSETYQKCYMLKDSAGFRKYFPLTSKERYFCDRLLNMPNLEYDFMLKKQCENCNTVLYDHDKKILEIAGYKPTNCTTCNYRHKQHKGKIIQMLGNQKFQSKEEYFKAVNELLNSNCELFGENLKLLKACYR